MHPLLSLVVFLGTLWVRKKAQSLPDYYYITIITTIITIPLSILLWHVIGNYFPCVAISTVTLSFPTAPGFFVTLCAFSAQEGGRCKYK